MPRVPKKPQREASPPNRKLKRTLGRDEIAGRLPAPKGLVTKLLGKAFEAASDLPAAEQDELAARILDEVAWERSWDAGAGREKLRQMVEQARADIQADRVRVLRPKDL